MGNGIRGRAGWSVLAVAGAAAVLASPARAVRGGVEPLLFSALPAEGTSLGVGGDGSIVFYSSDSGGSSLADTGEVPSLMSWVPEEDAVNLVGRTGNLFGDGISVDSRTLNLFSSGNDQPTPKRLFAVAARSSEAGEGAGAGLEPGGSSIRIEDSDVPGAFFPGEGWVVPTAPYGLSSPSVALKVRITLGRVMGKTDEVPVAAEVADVSAAYAGNLTGVADNADGNQEIFLWTKSRWQGAAASGGDFGDSGVEQITHTVADAEDIAADRTIACSSPALNRRGAVAFVSNADITGDNPDRVAQLFLWKRGRFRQLTTSVAGTMGGLRWSADGRVLVFEGTGDLVRANPDESSEIFAWDGRRVRQVTEGTTGASHSPSTGARGSKIAFTTTADLPGLVYMSDAPEVVVASRTGRSLRQVTSTDKAGLDAETAALVTNESPVLTSGFGRSTLTFVSSADLDGSNSTNSRRIWRTRVPNGLGR